MRDLFRRLFCPHSFLKFVRNLYGDQIIQAGYKRSEWKCTLCGAPRFKSHLYKENEA